MQSYADSFNIWNKFKLWISEGKVRGEGLRGGLELEWDWGLWLGLESGTGLGLETKLELKLGWWLGRRWGSICGCGLGEEDVWFRMSGVGGEIRGSVSVLGIVFESKLG